MASKNKKNKQKNSLQGAAVVEEDADDDLDISEDEEGNLIQLKANWSREIKELRKM